MKKKLKKLSAIVMILALCLTTLVIPSFAEDSTDDYTIIALLNWLSSDDCTIELTDTQASDVTKALSLYDTYSGYFDLSDDDDAANLDNVLDALDEIDLLSSLVTADDNFTGYNDYYTNFTMLTGSAYTANISIDETAHVSSFSSFASTEGLAWGYKHPSAGWYTEEKSYFDSCRDSLGYSAPITYGSSTYKAIVNAAASAGYTTGHYTNLFYCGTAQLIGVGYTTERGGAGYSKTWSYNTSTTTASKSGKATYTTSEIRTIIYTYICEEVNGGHTWDDGEVTAETTCTQDGVTVYTCSVCGTTRTETTEATGHNYESAVTEATCTEGGYTTCTCSICGDTYTTDETEATGHNYESAVTEATCTEGGYTTYTCSVCGDTYISDETEAAGHTFGEWSTVTSPTCTDTGSQSRTCSVCGYTETENLDAAGHTWESDYTVDVEATCTTDGSKSVHCTRCDAVKDSEVIPATGHSFTDYVYNDDATCTEDGTMTAVCDNGCGETDTVTAEGTATGHDYDYDNMEWYWADDYSSAAVIVRCKNDSTHTQLIEATVTSRISDSGVSTIYTAVVEIDGETYESGWNVPFSSGYADEECDDGDHVWDDGVEIKEATCTEDGLIEYTCQICGKTITEIISAGHFYVVSVSKEPTCTEEGEYVFECQVCGYTYTEAAEMLLHTYDYDNGVITKEATCEEEGEITYTCQVCGNTETDTIAATGHNYDYENVSWEWSEDYTSAALTVTCTNNPEHTESYEAWVTRSVVTDATCTESGTVEYTAAITLADITYEDTRTVEIEAFGHNEGNPVIENYIQGDCTQNGSYDTVIYCTECGEELSRETTIVETEREGGHNYYFIFDEEDAACTEDGYIIYLCDGCDSTYTETIKATGHDYIVLLSEDATCTEEGYTVYICSVCGDTYTGKTEATGHSFTDYVYNDDATCTEDGTMTAVCDNGCGETDTVTAEGTATGHDFDYDNIEWNWSEDYSTAAAIVRCRNNSLHTELIVAEVTAESGDFESVYTAAITVDGVAYTDTVTVQNDNTNGEDPQDNDSQPDDDTTTGGEDSQPDDDTTTGGEDLQPDDDTTTGGEDLQPDDDTTTNGGEDTLTGDDTTNGGEDTLTGDDTANGGNDTLTGDDTVNGGNDTTTDSGDNTITGDTTDDDDDTLTDDETSVSSSTDTGSADDDETSPATGDENHTMLWILLSIICVIMLAGAVTAMIEKNKKFNN